MRMTARVALSLAAAVVAASAMLVAIAAPAPGWLDPSFGTGGKVVVPPGGFDLAYGDISLVVDAQDRMVVVGSLRDPAAGNQDLFVARFDPDGSPDGSFANNGFLALDRGGDEYASEVTIDPLGRIVAAGHSIQNGVSDALVLRLNPDGTFDQTFGSEGVVHSNFGHASAALAGLAIDVEQTLLAVNFSDGSGSDAVDFSAPVRLNPDGSPDATFGNQGVGDAFDAAYAADIVLDEQSRPILGGSPRASTADALIARYTPTGDLDPTFSGDGSIRIDFADRDDFLQQLEIDGRQRVLAAVYFTNSTRTGDDMGVARVTPEGTLDRSFSQDGKSTVDFGTQSDVPLGLAVDRNDEVVVVGRTPGGGQENEPYDYGVARISEGGELDRTFSGDGLLRTDFAGRDDWAFDAAIDAEGRIVVAGRAVIATAGARQPVLGLARYMGGPHGPAPSLSVDDAGVREGDRGSKTVYLRVSLSQAPTTAVSVRLKDESYSSERDLSRVDSVVHFEVGETTKRVAVKVYGDLQRNEGIERYAFRLRDASGAVIGDGTGILTIRDDRDPCDIVGTQGPDRMVGTRGVTCALGGNDFIDGGHNFDKIVGGEGNDVMYGNAANDILVGGSGADRLYGGSGTDTFDGGSGRDRCIDWASFERRDSC